MPVCGGSQMLRVTCHSFQLGNGICLVWVGPVVSLCPTDRSDPCQHPRLCLDTKLAASCTPGIFSLQANPAR